MKKRSPAPALPSREGVGSQLGNLNSPGAHGDSFSPSLAKVDGAEGGADVTHALDEALLAFVANDPQYQQLSDDGKGRANEFMQLIMKKMADVKEPLLQDDGSIEVQLSKGGKLCVKEPTAAHVMRAHREMDIFTEKGDKDRMLHIYVMVAASTIDDVPATVQDLESRLSAKEFIDLTCLFKTINLL